jgi:hypothetical protein
MAGVRGGRWWVVVAAVVALAACGRGSDQPSAGDRPTVVVPVTSADASSSVASSIEANPVPPSGPATAPTLVLERDGLGVAAFGESAEDAIGAVTAVLGEPDLDSGWVEPLSIGACAGTAARFVAWGSLYLYLADESQVANGERHFFSYSYGDERDLAEAPEGLATPEGIGLGTTVEFLRAAYEGVAVEPGEEGLIAPTFYVDDRLSGRLTGDADDDLVTVIIGGDPCGVSM